MLSLSQQAHSKWWLGFTWPVGQLLVGRDSSLLGLGNSPEELHK